MATNYSDILQDSAYPSDYPASVGWVLRQIVTGRSLVEGYLYQGAFYADSEHTTAITATKERIYVDLSSGTAFRWTGSAYVTISVSSASDLSAVHYTADEVSASQQAVARSNIGAADATTVSTLSTTVARLVGKESAWDAKEGAITYDANPTADSTNCVKSGGIFSWVTNLFTNLTLAWGKITGTPTTVDGYGITDAVKSIKIGSAAALTPTNGQVTIDSVEDAGAVRFDKAQSLSNVQLAQARQNLGISSATITAKAMLVADAWSAKMSDREQTALLTKLVEYVKAKEGLS